MITTHRAQDNNLKAIMNHQIKCHCPNKQNLTLSIKAKIKWIFQDKTGKQINLINFLETNSEYLPKAINRVHNNKQVFLNNKYANRVAGAHFSSSSRHLNQFSLHRDLLFRDLLPLIHLVKQINKQRRIKSLNRISIYNKGNNWLILDLIRPQLKPVGTKIHQALRN